MYDRVNELVSGVMHFFLLEILHASNNEEDNYRIWSAVGSVFFSSLFCELSVGDGGGDNKVWKEVGNIQITAADNRKAVSSSLEFVRVGNTSTT
jgi:hypothetical protein